MSLILLTGAVLIGLLTVSRWSARRWPRFVIEGLHRNFSLLATIFLVVHIASSVLDSYVSITWMNAVVPFGGTYKPLWLGMGALALDVFVAVAVTSLIRVRLGHRAWRAVHWLAYGCFGLAVIHGLGIGSDRHQVWFLAINLAAVVSVGLALTWRVASAARTAPGAPGTLLDLIRRPAHLRRSPTLTAQLTRAPRRAGSDALGPGRPRILGGSPAAGLDEHEARYGRLESDSALGLLDEVELSGLRGRGGAGFPTHLKMRAVVDNARGGLRRRTPVIVANGTESEPASAKDTVLLRAAPHLVLDGVVAAGIADRGAKSDRLYRP